MAARTAFYAPAHRVLGRVPPGSAGPASDAAPSFDYLGSGIQDQRLVYNLANSATGAGIIGWWGSANTRVVSQVPSAIATANIAALAAVTSGTPMTLVSSTGSGITVLSSTMICLPSLNTIPIGALAIDGLPSYVDFATLPNGFHTKFYNPTTAISRGVSITGVASGTGGNFLVKGADYYGYPMTQLITVAAGVNTVASTKAFKFIYSVTPQFTDTHTYSVGTADLFGFNMFTGLFSDADIYYGAPPQALITSSGGTYTAGVTTTASSTTGDVRGTWAPTSNATDGTKRLDMFVTSSINRLTAPVTGLWGVTQA